MSYILDALRRADSERERERSAVPGLHTQAVPAGSADADTEPRPVRWAWPVAAAFVVLLGLVGWLVFDRIMAPGPQQAPAAAAPAGLAPPVGAAATALPAAPAPAAPAAAVPTPAPLAAAPTGAGPTAAPTPQRPAAEVVRKPTAPPAAPRKATASAAAEPKPAASPVAATRTAAAAAVAASASEPEPRISALGELPEDIRRSLPTITVGGSIYSKSAANRMLVINGQVFHEGDELAPGLVLEQIRQKAAVLRIKGYRYEISY